MRFIEDAGIRHCHADGERGASRHNGNDDGTGRASIGHDRSSQRSSFAMGAVFAALDPA
jgi:hypothetical protein